MGMMNRQASSAMGMTFSCQTGAWRQVTLSSLAVPTWPRRHKKTLAPRGSQGFLSRPRGAAGSADHEQQMVTPVWYFLSLMISLILKIPLRPFLLMCIFTSRSSSSRYAPEHMARKLDLEVLT